MMNMKRTAAIVLAILLSVSFAAAETGTDWLTADDISRETMTAYAEYSALQRLNAKMMAGTLYHVAAEDDTLIDWMFALPNNFDSGKTYDIVVTALHGDSINNYDQQIRCTQGQMYDALRALNQNGGSYILLSPVIPRPGDIYPVGFDRRIFFSRDRYEEIYLDPDRQLLGAYALLQAWLVDHNVKVRAGLFIEGFSAGGMFAQRFTVLHPDVVRGCAAGQMGGLVTMPVEKVDGATLTWPEGISDYEEMMGYPFDLEAYQAIPQLLYIGSGDMKNSMIYRQWDDSGFFGDYNEVLWIMDRFGETDPQRIENQAVYLIENGFDQIRFRTYESTGHQRIAFAEILKFFDECE